MMHVFSVLVMHELLSNDVTSVKPMLLAHPRGSFEDQLNNVTGPPCRCPPQLQNIHPPNEQVYIEVCLGGHSTLTGVSSKAATFCVS